MPYFQFHFQSWSALLKDPWTTVTCVKDIYKSQRMARGVQQENGKIVIWSKFLVCLEVDENHPGSYNVEKAQGEFMFF